MRHLGQILVFGLIGAGVCACRDNSPAVAPAFPPEVGRDTYRREADYPKPLPDSAADRPVAPRATVTPPPAPAEMAKPLPRPAETEAAPEQGMVPVSDDPAQPEPKRLPAPLPPPPPPVNE